MSKYIHLFSTESAENTAYNEEYLEPGVSVNSETNEVLYNKDVMLAWKNADYNYVAEQLVFPYKKSIAIKRQCEDGEECEPTSLTSLQEGKGMRIRWNGSYDETTDKDIYYPTITNGNIGGDESTSTLTIDGVNYVLNTQRSYSESGLTLIRLNNIVYIFNSYNYRKRDETYLIDVLNEYFNNNNSD